MPVLGGVIGVHCWAFIGPVLYRLLGLLVGLMAQNGKMVDTRYLGVTGGLVVMIEGYGDTGAPYVIGGPYVIRGPYVFGGLNVFGGPYVIGGSYFFGGPYVIGGPYVTGGPYGLGGLGVIGGFDVLLVGLAVRKGKCQVTVVLGGPVG